MEAYDGVVDVNQDSRVRRTISTWESNQRAGRSTSSSRDGDLAAGEVELRTSYALRDVQPDLLHAEQIVTTGRRRGDGEGHCRVAYRSNWR